jgi:hypothetical protein
MGEFIILLESFIVGRHVEAPCEEVAFEFAFLTVLNLISCCRTIKFLMPIPPTAVAIQL